MYEVHLSSSADELAKAVGCDVTDASRVILISVEHRPPVQILPIVVSYLASLGHLPLHAQMNTNM